MACNGGGTVARACRTHFVRLSSQGHRTFEWTHEYGDNKETVYRVDLEAMTQTNLESELSRTLQVVLVIMF